MEIRAMRLVLAGLAGIPGCAAAAPGDGDGGFPACILIAGETWQLVGDGYRFSEGTAVDRDGTVYFNDIQASKGYRIDAHGVVEWCADTRQALGQTFGADGRTRFTVSWGAPEVVRHSPSGERSVFCAGILGNDIVCHPSGNLYLTNPPGITAGDSEPSRIWLLRPDGERVLVYEGAGFTNGIAISPDGKTLYVNLWRAGLVHQFAIREDGLLGDCTPFASLAGRDGQEIAGADGMRVDRAGRVWVTSRIGIQVFDPEGRPLGVLAGPEDRCSHLVFGGPCFDTLYLTTVKAVYKRRLNVRGLNPWDGVSE